MALLLDGAFAESEALPVPAIRATRDVDFVATLLFHFSYGAKRSETCDNDDQSLGAGFDPALWLSVR